MGSKKDKEGLIESAKNKKLSMLWGKRVPHKEFREDSQRKYEGNSSLQFAYANRCLREGAKEGDFNKVRDAVMIYQEQGRKPNKFLKDKIGQAREEYEKRFPENRWPEMDEVLEAYVEERPIKNSGIRNGPWIAILSLITGLFFLSPNLTGNVIGNITNSTSNWIGGILFILGIVGIFVSRKLI